MVVGDQRPHGLLAVCRRASWLGPALGCAHPGGDALGTSPVVSMKLPVASGGRLAGAVWPRTRIRLGTAGVLAPLVPAEPAR